MLCDDSYRGAKEIAMAKVYLVNYEHHADEKVYRVNYEHQADEKVYLVNYEHQTT
jgi:hypothetical protein